MFLDLPTTNVQIPWEVLQDAVILQSVVRCQRHNVKKRQVAESAIAGKNYAVHKQTSYPTSTCMQVHSISITASVWVKSLIDSSYSR